MSVATLERPGARRLPWGRWSLRGIALMYLGGMVALPVVAVVAKAKGKAKANAWREFDRDSPRQAGEER